VLFGEYGPSARLPCSFPRSPGQQPYYYAHKPTGRPNPSDDKLEPYKAHYRGIPNKALYPFGHGLTYGKIDYSDLSGRADAGVGRRDLTVTATITNRGIARGEEVVQLYIRDRAASVTRPVRELKAFRKVKLAPGASETVTFKLNRALLLFIGRDNKPTVEPGTFDVWIAPSAETEGVHAHVRAEGVTLKAPPLRGREKLGVDAFLPRSDRGSAHNDSSTPNPSSEEEGL
jgi:beta-glucosidase